MTSIEANETGETWRVFKGDGVSRPNRPLPPPPPWRTFPRQDVDPGAKYAYLTYPRLVNAVNLAISLRRPLLLTGQAGYGKSSVAEAVAHELGLGAVLRWNITSRSSLEASLYRYDALGRLQYQQRNNSDALEKFLRLGPLGTALISPRQRVLLIDELDKSDIDLPSDLLHVLDRGEFEIPELARHDQEDIPIRPVDGNDSYIIRKGQVRCTVFPIIVMTSNGEREFSPAFLRRCIRERIEVPDFVRLASIVEAHLGADVARRAQDIVADFATRIGSQSNPAMLAIDQLLNTVLMMTREDSPADGSDRQELIDLMQKELRES